MLRGVLEGERVDRAAQAPRNARGISFEAAMAKVVAPSSLRRMTKAEDNANMALFVATPAGADSSGPALSVCGDHADMA